MFDNRKPLYAALVGGRSVSQDNIFIEHPSQDGRTAMYRLLQLELQRHQIILHTPDILKSMGVKAQIEIHINARKSASNTIKKYVLLIEAPHTRPINEDWAVVGQYRKIFTWREDWLSNKPNTIRIAGYPIPLRIPKVDVAKRERLCCMVAANKACQHINPTGSLYQERVKTLQWFEYNHPESFDLYGSGWQYPVARPGVLGQLQKQICKAWGLFKPAAQLCYRGLAASKQEVLQQTQFNICYENVAAIPGYMTEKIFDAIGAGCIPVYWGVDPISTPIPAECYLHRPDFKTHESLYEKLLSMPLAEIQNRQTAMREFLESPQAQLHSAEHFAKSVTLEIIHDLPDSEKP